MKFLIISMILFSMPAMSNKVQLKHYRLTQEEAGSVWKYFYKEELNIGPLSNKIRIEKCYVAKEVGTFEKVEIPCSEMDKLKSTLDLREVDVTQRSASAI